MHLTLIGHRQLYKVFDRFNRRRLFTAYLVDARTGADLTTTEAKEIASIVKPLLDKGLSPYHIVTVHPELGISEKTLYNYIDGQVFAIAGISNIVFNIAPSKVEINFSLRLFVKQACQIVKKD